MKMKLYLGLLVILFVSCNQVQEEEFELEGFNWKGLKQCFQDVVTFAPEIQELIDLIKDAKYQKAITLAENLIKEGTKVVRDCVNRFKRKNLSALPPKKVKPAMIDFCELNYRKTHKNVTIEEIHNAPEYKECKNKLANIKNAKQDECVKKCKEKKSPLDKNFCIIKCKNFRQFKQIQPIVKLDTESEIEPTLEAAAPTIQRKIPFPKPTFPIPGPLPIPFPRPIKK